MENIDHYRVLGVLDDAEEIVIRAAYKVLAQKYHPDKWTTNPDEASSRMADINAAYAVLADPVRRKQYDSTRDSSKYNPGKGTNESATEPDETAKDWAIATQYYQDLPSIASGLAKISTQLSFTFKLALLESKQFEKRSELAAILERAFLNKYFGSNVLIQNYAKELILEEQREAAIELNAAVNVLGPNIDADRIISSINNKYRPARVTREAEEKIQEQIQVNREHNLMVVVVVFLLFLISISFLLTYGK